MNELEKRVSELERNMEAVADTLVKLTVTFNELVNQLKGERDER